MSFENSNGGVFRPVLKLATVALIAVMGFGTAASAVTAPGCSTANLTTSTKCVSNIPGGNGGNVTEAQMNGGAGVFGVKTWTTLGKIDTTKNAGNFVSPLFTVSTAAGNGSGTWTLAPGYRYAPGASYALALKGSTYNAAYLLDTAFTSGTWTNGDLWTPNGRNNAGLSNMTLLGTATPAPVPLPAAAWLLLAGLAGLGAVARSRRQSATA